MTDFEVDRSAIMEVDPDDASLIKRMFRELGRRVFEFHGTRLTIAELDEDSSLRPEAWLNHAIAQVAQQTSECKNKFSRGVLRLFAGPNRTTKLKKSLGCFGYSAVELLIMIAERTVETVASYRPRSAICEQFDGHKFWCKVNDDGSLTDLSQAGDFEAVNARFSDWPELVPLERKTSSRTHTKQPKNAALLEFSQKLERQGLTYKRIVAIWNEQNPDALTTEASLRTAKSRDKKPKS